MTETSANLRRRDILLGGGAAAVLGAVSLSDAKAQEKDVRWDRETDVVAVGGGAAALTAAATARAEGAEVIVVERAPILGGTTAKSGAVFWIPNHFILRQNGVKDGRTECLQYLARYSYPERYTADSPTMGLAPEEFKLLEAFYDNGSAMTDYVRKIGAVDVGQWRMWDLDRTAPDYLEHVPENRVPEGRPLGVKLKDGKIGWGTDLIAQLEEWLTAKKVPILTDHRVTRIVTRDGAVVGVQAEHDGKTVSIRARKGVVFGTGGYAHNVDLIHQHQPAEVYGSCAQPYATGDFIALAGAVGAKMGNLSSGWRTQVVLEEALENRVLGLGVFFAPGDSMLMVNKYGKRVVNEKRNYNDRTRVHYEFKPTTGEYPNHLLFMVYDRRAMEVSAGMFPFPENPDNERFMIKGDTLDELAENIDRRLAKLADKTGNVRLAEDFAPTFKQTVDRFNGFARKGKDEDFQRGEHEYDRVWNLMFGAKRDDTRWGVSDYPNPVLHPLQDKGPYYAIILGGGVLDTNGGAVINEKAQVLSVDGKPIPGLYGAGNCVASPSRSAYYGAGGTIGLAMTFGYIAGKDVAAQRAREI